MKAGMFVWYNSDEYQLGLINVSLLSIHILPISFSLLLFVILCLQVWLCYTEASSTGQLVEFSLSIHMGRLGKYSWSYTHSNDRILPSSKR